MASVTHCRPFHGAGDRECRWLSPRVRNMPVSVRPPDLVTIAPVALLIAAVAMVACLAPALRAARVDPRRLLRGE
jgi:ABC-type lipoprotein release transport system permease subunit